MTTDWALPTSFRIRLSMNSDWHIGSGMGRPGHIDRLIARDATGLPFVPAKSLRGIWRDACERLCQALDGNESGDWSRLVDRLFGSQPALGDKDPTRRHSDSACPPLESSVSIRPARIAEPLRSLLAKSAPVHEALTFVKPGVSIDRRSGMAKTNFLRFEEMARGGTILEAECRLDVPENLRPLASALLIASAQLVERIGAKRRRGAGRCQLQIVSAQADQAINWLCETDTPPEWPDAPSPQSPAAASETAVYNGEWVVVPLTLNLHSPLAVSYRTVGNVVETLDFLPGSYLLPHVRKVLTASGVDCQSAIQRGDLCVLPATIEIEGQRGQPVPLAFFGPKGGQGFDKPCRLINRMVEPEQSGDEQFKPIRDGYLRPGTQSLAPAAAVRPAKVVQTHNTVEDRFQRPTEDVGGVYTYQALAPVDAGQSVRLRSELRLRKSLADRLEERHPEWWTKLSGTVSLGRSKKDDYGAVAITAGPPAAPSPVAKTGAAKQPLFVWLLSDTLLRNQQLRPEPTAQAVANTLGQRLGVTVKLRSGNADLMHECVRVRRLETWHVGWGLPRPSFVALQAGSCLVLELEGTVDPQKLADLEASGIGERTAEGYGQIRFNDPLMTISPRDWKTQQCESQSHPQPAPPKPIPANSPAVEYASLLEREVWKQEIRRECLKIAGDEGRRQPLLHWKSRQPPMSQLGSLRGQLAQLRSPADAPVVLGWLDHLASNPRRRDKWPDESLPMIRNLLSDPGQIWKIIDTSKWPTLIVGATTRLQQELWALAVRTVFDACIRAHKRDLERQEVSHGT